MWNLSRAGKVTRVSAAVAAGQTAVTGDSVSMDGFESVTFYALLGALTATNVTTLKAQQSHDDGGDDAFADLEGTGVQVVAADGDNLVLILEVNNPRERFVRPVITRATANAVVDGIIAVQTGPKEQPVTHDASVGAAEFHHAPAEGTA